MFLDNAFCVEQCSAAGVPWHSGVPPQGIWCAATLSDVPRIFIRNTFARYSKGKKGKVVPVLN
jgi:hypothetical protein